MSWWQIQGDCFLIKLEWAVDKNGPQILTLRVAQVGKPYLLGQTNKELGERYILANKYWSKGRIEIWP